MTPRAPIAVALLLLAGGGGIRAGEGADLRLVHRESHVETAGLPSGGSGGTVTNITNFAAIVPLAGMAAIMATARTQKAVIETRLR